MKIELKTARHFQSYNPKPFSLIPENDKIRVNWGGEIVNYCEDMIKVYATIADETGWGFIVINDKDNIQFINSICAELIKMKPDSILGKNAKQLIRKLGIETINHYCEGKAKCYDITFDERNIFIRQFLVSSDRSSYRIQIWQDLAQPSRAIKELRDTIHQNELLKGILNGVFEDIAAVDKEGHLLYMSDKTANALGVDSKTVVGMPMKEIRTECLMEKVARTGVPELGKIWRVGDVYIPAIVVPLMIEGQQVGSVCRSVFRDLDDAEGFIGRLQQYYRTVVMKDEKEVKKGTANRSSGASYTFDDIIGDSELIQRAKDLSQQAAKSDASVLITGETGTGKELFAHAIHNVSNRANKPFVKVNCASIPESLMESELFGYEDGAFTGAKRGGKPGKFELADKGTLFLDEIGDMKLDMQAKLLRALQEGEIEKVGRTKSFKVNVRIVAATNRDLIDMVSKGEFREDLFYRLDVIRIDIPPLRHRKKDLEALVNNFLSILSLKYGKESVRIVPEVLAIFYNYWWPGNVRELANIIEGSLCLIEDNTVDLNSLPKHFLKRLEKMDKGIKTIKLPSCTKLVSKPKVASAIGSKEEDKIKNVLELTGGNKRQAAAILGVSRSTLYEKIKKYTLVN